MKVKIKEFQENGVLEILVYGNIHHKNLLAALSLRQKYETNGEKVLIKLWHDYDIDTGFPAERWRKIRKTKPYNVIIHVDNIKQVGKS